MCKNVLPAVASVMPATPLSIPVTAFKHHKEYKMPTTVEIDLPPSLRQLGVDAPMVRRSIREWSVFTLFTEGRISSGKAATLLGITRHAFLDLLRERGIAYVNYGEDEVASEVDAASQLPIAFP
jgi:predicted HTH domain antitoxin